MVKMEALWLVIGILFGVSFSAILLICYQLKRISNCEHEIRKLKESAGFRPREQRKI